MKPPPREAEKAPPPRQSLRASARALAPLLPLLPLLPLRNGSVVLVAAAPRPRPVTSDAAQCGAVQVSGGLCSDHPYRHDRTVTDEEGAPCCVPTRSSAVETDAEEAEAFPLGSGGWGRVCASFPMRWESVSFNAPCYDGAGLIVPRVRLTWDESQSRL